MIDPKDVEYSLDHGGNDDASDESCEMNDDGDTENSDPLD